MVRIKICGITNLEDALVAVGAGTDALGFVFAPSPRQVTPEQVHSITSRLPPFIYKVGVFVDADMEEVQRTMSYCHLDIAQLHGSESPEFCQALFPRVIKSFRVKDDSVLSLLPRYKVSAYLLDSYDPHLAGGTGKSFNWDIARKANSLGYIILSGGLTPQNVTEAIEQVHPYAVDTSSGVESEPGKKDHAKVRAFIQTARAGQSLPRL